MTKTPLEALQELNRLKRLKDAGLPYSVEEKQQAWKNAFEAELSSAKYADNGWLPIESAPKDGTDVWLLSEEGQYQGYWYVLNKQYAYWKPLILSSHGCGCCSSDDSTPTHWRPLESVT